MSDFPNILSAKIVGDGINVFWNEKILSSDVKQMPVLVISADHPAGGAEETQLLKIIQACGVTAEQYYLLKLANDQQTAWHQLREKLQPKVVILVGIEPGSLGIAALLRLNTPNRFDDTIFIPSISLSDMEKYPEHKKELWLQGLKPVFVDKAHGDIL